MKLINFVLFLSALICSSRAYADQCSYSAYVDFGPAMNGGYIDKKELVYRTSGLIKNIRSKDVSKNFFASYSFYRQLKVGGFEIINIGPFDSESVAYIELQSVISEIIGRGYKKRTEAHILPAVIISNKNPC